MYRYTLCFIRKDDQLLMLNRCFAPMMGKWNGIGGKLEAGETPEQCVVRETREETDITITQPELLGTVTWITPKRTTGMYVYVATIPPAFAYPTPLQVAEGILDWKEVSWVLDANNTGIADNIQQILPHVLSGGRFDHQYTFDANDQIIDYQRAPLAVFQ